VGAVEQLFFDWKKSEGEVNDAIAGRTTDIRTRDLDGKYRILVPATADLICYFALYNHQRPHQFLGWSTSAEVYDGAREPRAQTGARRALEVAAAGVTIYY
jgi:hypothetical protein